MPYWRLRECSSGSEPPTTSPFDAYSVKLGKWPHWTSPFGMRGRTPRLMCTALKWGGTVNRPLFMTVYSHRTRSHVGCNTLPHFFTRPGGSTRPAAPTQRNQLKPPNSAVSAEGTDGGFSPLEPRVGDYPIWLRLSSDTDSTPFLLSRSQADGSLMPTGADPQSVPDHRLAMSQPAVHRDLIDRSRSYFAPTIRDYYP